MTPNKRLMLIQKTLHEPGAICALLPHSGSSMYAEDVVQEVFIKVLMILREEPSKEINENYLRRAVVTMTKDDLSEKPTL